MKNEQLRFDIDASVVFQLGEDLITDEIQAVTELVKNAYDADASYCLVTVDTAAACELGGRELNGLVSIDDDGHGMTIEDIQRGWLTISKSPKREMKEQGISTAKGRTPLGDKGLGRLGAQRLGNYLAIRTTTQNDGPLLEVSFDWRDFRNHSLLGQVPVAVEEFPNGHRRGTQVIIRDLTAGGDWAEPNHLRTQLSKMISPYGAVRDFDLVVEVDGDPIDLYEIAEGVRDLAQAQYVINFDGEAIRIEGRVKLDLVGKRNDDLFRQIVELDQGEAFWEYLISRRQSADLGLEPHPDPKWFVTFSLERSLEDVPGVGRVGANVASPGPFTGEVDAFSLAQEDWKGGVFDRLSDFREYVKQVSGVGVYRDGFAVRMPSDWLGLSKLQTVGTSYYGLRPGNVMGYISLSAGRNEQLRETTDREGFVADAYYQTFQALLAGVFVQFSTEAQGFLRRTYNDFRRDMAADMEGGATSEDARPEAILGRMASLAEEAKDIQEPVTQIRRRVTRIEEGSSKSQTVAARDGEGGSVRDDLSAVVQEIEEYLPQIESYLAALDDLGGYGQHLSAEFERLREQLELSYETMSLGLTAESLVHEFANIGDRLRRRAAVVAKHLEEGDGGDPVVSRFVNEVRSIAAAIRRQVARVSPSLRYVRERREPIELSDFLLETSESYSERWSEVPIKVFVRNPDEGFTVKFNRGKLAQVFDNLLLNSEYWLRHRLQSEAISSGEIVFALQEPFVFVEDNSGGVDPSVENSVFEPFVTTKPKGTGRGLGLFVVSQLLDSEGCSIFLDPKRNEHGRRYRFVIDLVGALEGASNGG